MTPTEIILKEVEKLKWHEWQRIVNAVEMVHKERANKLELADSFDSLKFFVEH